jgi:hypothetical protein
MITASYLTLAGSPHGSKPAYSMLERAKAAHAAGIPSIGVLWNEPFEGKAQEYVHLYEVEWFELDHDITAQEKQSLARLRETGCEMIKAGLCGKDARNTVSALISLAEIAYDLDMTVSVEPVAWGRDSSLADVTGLIEESLGWLYGTAMDTQMGICYDLWQVSQGTPWISRDIPVDKIAKAEVSGVSFPLSGSVGENAMNRPLIADSAISIPEWVANLRSRGFTGMVTYEQPNTWLRSLPLMKMAEAAAADMSLLEG